MTLQEFIEKIKTLDICCYKVVRSNYRTLLVFQDKKDLLPSYCIKKEWVIGGETGGSCWGTDNKYPVMGEKEPDFECLDIILEQICPEITHLKYKKLSKIEKEEESGDSDYYGNYTKSTIKYIVLKDLYNFLKENNLIE